MDREIKDIVLEVARDFAETLDEQPDFSQGSNLVLFGADGILDSVGLVSFVLDVEAAVEDEIGRAVTLADTRAMSQKNSPFRTVGTLSEYIEKLLEEKDV